MAVLDAAWWGVWWPWMVVWLLTAGAVATAVAVFVAARRRARTSGSRRHRGVVFYLDEPYVRGLDETQGGKYLPALEREVEERSSSNREVELIAEAASVGGRGRRGESSEIFRRYVEVAKPAGVIGVVVAALEREGDIVHADLRRHEVTGGDALARALTLDDDEPVPDAVRLGSLDTFVSLRAIFRVVERTEEEMVLEARYGEDTTPPAPGTPRVLLTCATSGLNDTAVPKGAFPARCLARVERWDEAEQVLVLFPVAVFR